MNVIVMVENAAGNVAVAVKAVEIKAVVTAPLHLVLSVKNVNKLAQADHLW